MPPAEPQRTRKTVMARLYEDQAEKLAWIYKLRGISTAEFIGPRIEKDLDAEFEKLRPIVEQLQAAQAVRDPEPPFANALGSAE